MHRNVLFALVVVLILSCGTSTQPQDTKPAPQDLWDQTDAVDLIQAETETVVGDQFDTAADQETVHPLPTECTSDADCPSQPPCIIGVCQAGKCSYEYTTQPCDDGDPCTENDICSNGVCAGQPIDCDDNEPCTKDECVQGQCKHTLLETPECALALAVTYPPPGAQLTGDSNIEVKITATTPVGSIQEVTVNGEQAKDEGDGNYTFKFQSRVGINILDVRAKDSNGRQAHVVRSFEFAYQYHDPGDFDYPYLLEDSSLVFGDKILFDDDDVGDVDDLATVAWIVLQNIDLASLIPHPLMAGANAPSWGWCTWTVDVSDVQYTMKDIELEPIPDGMELELTLQDFAAHFIATADWCPDAEGNIYADTIVGQALIEAVVTDEHTIQFKLDWVNVDVNNCYVDITGGVAELAEWLVNWFSDTLAEKIEQEAEEWIQTKFVNSVNGLLAKLTNYTTQFSLPPIPGSPVGNPISVRVAASGVDIDYDGAVIRAATGIGTDKAVQHTSLGSLVRGNCYGGKPGEVELNKGAQMTLALSEDLVNQLLFALWWGGYLNVLVSLDLIDYPFENLGIDTGVIQADPLLPPVITTCTEDGVPEVQLGGVNLTLSVSGSSISGTATLVGAIRVAVKPIVVDCGMPTDCIGLQILDTRQFSVAVVDASDELKDKTEFLEAMAKYVIVDTLINQYVGGILEAYPIPQVDLGNHITGIPQGTVVTFNPLECSNEEGYLVVIGEFMQLQ